MSSFIEGKNYHTLPAPVGRINTPSVSKSNSWIDNSIIDRSGKTSVNQWELLSTNGGNWEQTSDGTCCCRGGSTSCACNWSHMIIAGQSGLSKSRSNDDHRGQQDARTTGHHRKRDAGHFLFSSSRWAGTHFHSAGLSCVSSEWTEPCKTSSSEHSCLICSFKFFQKSQFSAKQNETLEVEPVTHVEVLSSRTGPGSDWSNPVRM